VSKVLFIITQSYWIWTHPMTLSWSSAKTLFYFQIRSLSHVQRGLQHPLGRTQLDSLYSSINVLSHSAYDSSSCIWRFSNLHFTFHTSLGNQIHMFTSLPGPSLAFLINLNQLIF
jgi:hypothetical protein